MNSKRAWEIGAGAALLCAVVYVGGALVYRSILSQQLLSAAAAGDAGRARRLLASGADANAVSAAGVTALMSAARGGHGEIVELLLARGARVDTRDRTGVTALVYAAPRGHLRAVAALLGAGADTEIRNINGHTPLLAVCFQPDYLPRRSALVRVLLEHGAKVNATDWRRRTTPLQWAAAKADVPLVRLLLAHGAHVRVQNREGFTALRWAKRVAGSDGALLASLAKDRGMPPVAKKRFRQDRVRHYADCLTVIRLLEQSGSAQPASRPRTSTR